MNREQILKLARDENYEWTEVEQAHGRIIIRNQEKRVSIEFTFGPDGRLELFETIDHETGARLSGSGPEFVEMPTASEALEWAWEAEEE